MYRIKELEIKDFRGFRHQKMSLPDADIVLVTGGNGFGKSSFFDAVEWGLTGNLRRYAGSNQERNSETILKNNYSKQNGFVRMVIKHEDSREIEFTRKIKKKQGNDFNTGELQGLTQKELENVLVREEYRDKYDFARIFNFSHLLSQELIDEFVRGFKATDRYSVLSHLIGIQDYVQYKDKIAVLEREVKREIDRLEMEIAILDKDIEKFSALVDTQFDAVTDVEGRFRELVQQYNTLVQGDGVTEFQEELVDGTSLTMEQRLKEIERFYGLVKQMHIVVVQNMTDTLGVGDRLTVLLAEFPQLENWREQVTKVTDSLKEWSRILGFYDKKVKIEETLADFFAYEKDAEDVADLHRVRQQIEAIGELLNILGREDSTVVEKAEKFLSLTEDVELRVFIDQLRKVDDEILRVKEKIAQFDEVNIRQKKLEMEIVQKAYRYFTEHLNVEHCPVCKADIKTEKLLEELQIRLDEEGQTLGLSPLLVEQDKLNAKREGLLKKLGLYLEALKIDLDQQLADALTRQEQLERYAIRSARVKNYLTDLGVTGDNVQEAKRKLEKMRSELAQTEIKNYTREQIAQRISEVEQTLVQYKNDIYRYELECSSCGIKEISEDALLSSVKEVQTRNGEFTAKSKILSQIIYEAEKLIFYLNNSLYMTELQDREQKIQKSQVKLEELIALQKQLHELSAHVPNLVNEMTSDVLNHYKKTVNEFYQLLNPQPFFTRLDWEVSQSNFNNGTLVLKSLSEDGKYQMNPSFTFSAAQVNLIALSFFLSFAVQQQWSKLGSIFMDDPIQNMDDINIFAFVDVIRGLCLNSQMGKQIFISTHDRKFLQFMLKKFRMLRVFVLDYKGFGEEGPVIETRFYEPVGGRIA